MRVDLAAIPGIEIVPVKPNDIRPKQGQAIRPHFYSIRNSTNRGLCHAFYQLDGIPEFNSYDIRPGETVQKYEPLTTTPVQSVRWVAGGRRNWDEQMQLARQMRWGCELAEHFIKEMEYAKP